MPIAVGLARWRSRRARRSVRFLITPYRGDHASHDGLTASLAGIHALLCTRGLRRLLTGQPPLALEVHKHARENGSPLAWFAICGPAWAERQLEAALRGAYPNAMLRRAAVALAIPPAMVRLHRRRAFTDRQGLPLSVEAEHPAIERVLRAMAAAGGSMMVQLALAPAPSWLTALAQRRGHRHTAGGAQRRGLTGAAASGRHGEDRRPSISETAGGAEPRGPLFHGDIRVVATTPASCRAVAAALRGVGESIGGLVARWQLRPLRPVCRMGAQVEHGELVAAPASARAVYTASELAMLWQLPSDGFAALPQVRIATPIAPAPPGILRAAPRMGLLRDAHGPVTIHPELRRQHTSVVGTVEQGKSSYLVASAKEDLRRGDCAVIVLDPKGDAADAALSAVPDGRTCTLLDMARPTCGFNPLAASARPDAIADYVVAAVRQLFDEGEVRGSSDRYLRNAVIASLAYERSATLWDVARLLAVGPEGQAARARVAHRITAIPEVAEVAAFLADELPTQLADARATTTAKLDAPSNKLARILNSASVVGNLTRDPELRAMPSGTSVCKMRVACSSRWRNAETGEWDERPNYFDVSAFGASGEACERFLEKGRPVAVDGRLSWHEWETDDGQHRQAVEIVADSVQFLGTRGPGGDDEAQPAGVGLGDDDGIAF